MSERVGLTLKKPEVNRDNSDSRMQRTNHSRSVNPSVDRILFLQKTVGNQAVQRLMKSKALQAKLMIGQPGDKYEQEADRVAEEVMRMPEPEVQRQVNPEEEEEELLQTKEILSQTPEVGRDLEARIHALKGGGQPLPTSPRAFFEPRFGYDFSRVRVHADNTAAASARAIGANAYTIGSHIVFAKGRYEPPSSTGQRLLAHELTHVVQQRGASLPPSSAFRFEPPDSRFEREAIAVSANRPSLHESPVLRSKTQITPGPATIMMKESCQEWCERHWIDCINAADEDIPPEHCFTQRDRCIEKCRESGGDGNTAG